ncbi:unnamed protein product [Schistocephalus solidus]|uniref:C2H2-type domain-containing protein n=1 Tax=Schistocephalus solidus TaxID=70667 RepID=A0A183SHL7_SCHSO|nr:unnamed protein product [Schistocephalus solidus]
MVAQGRGLVLHLPHYLLLRHLGPSQNARGWETDRHPPLLPSLPPPPPPASPDFSCPHCARNFNSRICLVDHLRIHRTEAGEPVPGAPTCSRRARLHSPHCSCTLTHRMGLLGHLRLHDNLW